MLPGSQPGKHVPAGLLLRLQKTVGNRAAQKALQIGAYTPAPLALPPPENPTPLLPPPRDPEAPVALARPVPGWRPLVWLRGWQRLLMPGSGGNTVDG